jgi:alpha-beta hydrolase superfamily lysophospholipase
VVAHEDGTLPNTQYWQRWRPDGPAKGAVVLVHGLHEHSGRYAHVAERLAGAGYTVSAVDHPGHGRTPGTRGGIRSMAETVHGVDIVVRRAEDAAHGAPVFVYGHSLGGLIALQYLTGRPSPGVRGGIISAPAVDLSTANGAQKLVAPLLSRIAPDLGVLTLDSDAVSRDPAVVAAYRADPLNRMGKVRARTGSEMLLATAAMPQRLARLTLPLLLLHGTADRLVPVAATELVRDRVGSQDVTVKIYDGLYHEPHNEPEKEQVLDDVVGWLDAHVAAPASA